MPLFAKCTRIGLLYKNNMTKMMGIVAKRLTSLQQQN
jgi:hypothetical protein